MKKKARIVPLLFALCLLVLGLTACGKGGDRGKDFIETPYAGSTLYVYNWGEYISDGSEGSLDVIREFEKRYGISVRYDYFSTNEELYAQLSSGASYDVIFPSDYMTQRLIDEGMLREINFASVPNYKDILPKYRKQYFDPDDKYSVPYTVGMLGIVYNTKLVDPKDVADRSWDILWNQKYSPSQRINMNNPRDAFGVAMLKEGMDVNTTAKADWDAAYRVLNEQNCIYLMDEIYNKMENGAAAVAAYYAGDCLVMMQENEDLDFYYPTEGTNIFIDSMCIPKSSKNPGAAELFINFMLDPDIATANANYICYASPSAAVRKHPDYDYSLENNERYYNYLYTLPESYAENEELMQFYKLLDDDTQKLLNSLWARLGVDPGEGGNYVGTYIFLGIVVVLIVGFTAYSIYDSTKKYKRAKRSKRKS